MDNIGYANLLTSEDERLLPLMTDSAVIERFESEVRVYSRGLPVVFNTANGSLMFDKRGKRYIDFLTAAGSLNYGHNHPAIKVAIAEYMAGDGIVQSLDFITAAKAEFIRKFNRIVLMPRRMDYKIQFTGPTGTNCVEAAIKLARKVTGRKSIATFTNAFHGVSMGSLALTGNDAKRRVAGVSLNDVVRLPFDGYMGKDLDTLAYIRKLLMDPSSGVDAPAAFIVETVQGEGGVNCASAAWLQGLAALAKENGALLIVDDIQAGCGRTGTFFSFEAMGIRPDLICLSKSLSGYGLPMAVLLIERTIDAWMPGDHNGTFRGGNLAFVGATAALSFWTDEAFVTGLAQRSRIIQDRLQAIVEKYPPGHAWVKGRGLFYGIEFGDPARAERARTMVAELGVVAETSGARNQVLKLMPALNIPLSQLEEGLALISSAVELA